MIKVSNIERFATHDGPGIRTTIFLQGCPLHCPWCANPETWTKEAQLMYDERKCIQCQSCMEVCPTHAISFPFHWDSKKCIHCQKCIDTCLQSAIHFSSQDMKDDEILHEILKDELYYQKSQGGVTFSGGEPCMQAKALIGLLKQLKQHNIHIAFETTGNYATSTLLQVMEYVDLFLFDMKHIDKDTLKEVTGADLDLILKNLNQIPKEKVIVRMPVIPGFNQHICKEVIQLAKSYSIQEVDLLPFHTLGSNKWEQIQREYAYKDKNMLDRKELESYVDYGKELGILVKIGG